MNKITSLLAQLLTCVLIVVGTSASAQYCLTVESSTPAAAAGTTYKFYVNMEDTSDRMSAVFGNNVNPLVVNVPEGAFSSTYNASWSASGINPAFLGFFPELADDTYATIGLTGPASMSGIAGAADPSIVEDDAQPITPFFTVGGSTELLSNTLTGSSYYVLNTAANGLPDADMRVLVMQITTTGSISGTLNYQIFPLGVGSDQIQVSVNFNGAGTFGGGGDTPTCGCTDSTACNYDADATYDDGSCAELDECGECGGTGIADGACDCDGNVNDALGVCGGTCSADADEDGICDDVDPCVGELDACGVCNGPGVVYECGCNDIPEEDCDCAGNQEDAIGVCGGDCSADADADGICDDVDDCVGALDECGVCNGDGAIYECGCSDIPASDCDCDGNQVDALGVCGGSCEADADGNGVCDNAEIAGCVDSSACNYDLSATQDDGSCDYCSCGDLLVGGLNSTSTLSQYGIEIDEYEVHTSGDLAGMTTYRLYVTMPNPTDAAISFTGNDEFALELSTTTSFYQEPIFGSSTPENSSSAALGLIPNLAYDSWVTVGISGPSTSGESDISLLPGAWEVAFENGNSFVINDGVGSGWYVLPTATNGIAGVEGRMLFAQLTTDGDISGSFRVQIFPEGDSENDDRADITFSLTDLQEIDVCGCTDEEASNYDSTAQYDDGSCEYIVLGCIDSTACNYDSNANTDDGSCLELDECGECGGTGITNGDCDCDGNQLDVLGVCGGGCTADADADGICDDVDDCVGALDECGVCNGDGAIYECGCSDIPEGDCDCDGNQEDALGVCGGGCSADADSDGICDDVDDCVGEYDECGICNGNGAIYECGCSDIPEGDCDCDGNQADAIGVCGGNCESDLNGNGVCDDAEVGGCMDALACNYNADATEEDGSCDYCSCLQTTVPYTLTVEASAPASADGTTYRFYVNMLDASDRMSAVFGNDVTPLEVHAPAGVFSSAMNSSWSASGINPAFLSYFPDMADDTYATIGLTGPAATSGIADAADPSIVEDANQLISPFFINNGATELLSNTSTGSSYYVLNTAANGLPDADGRVLVMQVTTTGSISGVLNYQVFPLGVGADQVQVTIEFDGAGTFGGGDEDTISCGCMDESACNYDENADYDDGSCAEFDECGECGGTGIADGACDCDGNVLDALGVCGGDCSADADADGICDDEDDCVGEYDECGVCNGDGAIYECGCSDIPEGDCDCDGNQLDALGECGGDCSSDADADGICDNVDDCVGEYDECGVCNGEGAIYECGCSDIPEGDCDCDGNQEDALGECGGDCTDDADEDGICDDEDDCVGEVDALGVCNGDCAADSDEDGICDDEDDCVGEYDECGVCNGEGAIYDCGCSDIPEGDCDCDGNQLDAAGVCGGDCTADEDGDGLCDDEDNCVGEYDECGICNGEGAIYECGCSDMPEGDCDCDGNQLDVIGVCGGDCTDDADEDGICDDEDECIGVFDECGVCNGPGAVYECGCSDMPEDDCDCYGNQIDALGVCGGDCGSDADMDDICDDVDDCVDLDGTNCEISGCTDPSNPGYDPSATVDDGSCLVGGCVLSFACNYDPDADYQLPGACDFSSCQGCTDPAACNYDSDATLDDNSCYYANDYHDCNGLCLHDMDGDGVCDEEEIEGCTDPEAVNYDPVATEEDGSCWVAGCIIPFACNYNPDADYISLLLCDFSSCVGCMDDDACNFDPDATLPAFFSCDYPEAFYLDCDGNCNNDTDGDGVCDEIEVEGCMDEDAWNYNPYATDDSGDCFTPYGGCVLPFACNFDPFADYFLPGSCDFSCLWGEPQGMIEGNCADEYACNFGEETSCRYINDEGEICMLGGCTLDNACNYNSSAQFNDGSCEFISCANQVNLENTVDQTIHPIHGCTIQGACNFSPEANTNDGSCDFATCGIIGCTDHTAVNYNNRATISDASCEYDVVSVVIDESTVDRVVKGCTNDMACNFNFAAIEDDGSCEYSSCYGCMSSKACNYNAEATHPANCEFLEARIIEGPEFAQTGVLTEYKYAVGSEVVWSISEGEIVSNDGRGTIKVVWNSSDQIASLTAAEFSSEGCKGLDARMSVEKSAEAGTMFSMFPNPANNVLTINLKSTNVNLQILDASGRVIESRRINNSERLQIDLNNFANGTYTVVISNSTSRTVKPLVIAH